MQKNLTRRTLMKSAAVAGLATAFTGRSAFAANEPLGITLVVPSPIGDVGWGHALAAGLDPIKAAYGDKVKVTVIENIAEGPDADRIMNKTVTDGNHFLIAGSFGYQNGALQVARRNPKVSVLHASGFQVAPNFSPFAAKYFQGTYLLGMAAAAVSKTGKLGSVSAFAIPELITSVNAFTLGAQAVKPDIEVSVVWVNSWFDPAKEQEAAKALISQGCDVIFSNAQDTPSVISACEEAGVYAFNLNSSMKKYAPKTYLGCVSTDWSPFFKASVDAHLAGTFKGANAFLGVAEKVVQVVDWSTAIPTDTMAKIKETEGKIASGSFSPFTGPITKADGSEGAASGATLTDAQIVAMDWHVKGVKTPLPK
ncbi:MULTISPECIES: BMP family ABC transporter substrate-binding protein [Rhizobium]|uniref:BMP family ABC transporter substrate-binding protein n=1 Tax=Rhizobium tropici TaxID=398 RepID=A0A6P1CE32_RHITR|nr:MULTISPECIES: BMP family ABC transporter substrate-binding protein [Rhizobium]AGB74072.1 putative purine-binding protein [Rhizobium tropici CIAT 899]MBB4240561.1 simple sugar transport system substrate-binding protein [Rhizobium tropici]MBB5592023.1 simple sugar transport system substrate-binding protein [Rhizobium tropici]MBB6491077.1 simple sugar transport system substrate-binding protein [Rhizobium tropici]NEV13094.1 BMP family ABC transporter substrate-binding protein [Rhizobium tropici